MVGVWYGNFLHAVYALYTLSTLLYVWNIFCTKLVLKSISYETLLDQKMLLGFIVCTEI